MRLDEERLQDILEAIEAIERHLPGDKAGFDADEMVRVWCLRHLEIIGEAAANLSQDIRDKSSDIPWRPIIGMRNTLIHAYFDVNWLRVWQVLAHDIQPLKLGVLQLLQQIEGDRT